MLSVLFVVYGRFSNFTSDGLTTATADHVVANLVVIVTTCADMRRTVDSGSGPARHRNGTNIHIPKCAGRRFSHLSEQLPQPAMITSLPRWAFYFDTFDLYQEMKGYPAAFELSDVVDHPTEHVQVIVAGESS